MKECRWDSFPYPWRYNVFRFGAIRRPSATGRRPRGSVQPIKQLFVPARRTVFISRQGACARASLNRVRKRLASGPHSAALNEATTRVAAETLWRNRVWFWAAADTPLSSPRIQRTLGESPHADLCAMRKEDHRFGILVPSMPVAPLVALLEWRAVSQMRKPARTRVTQPVS